jgi:organic hydroperoxide reductase OsmC/OhrA
MAGCCESGLNEVHKSSVCRTRLSHLGGRAGLVTADRKSPLRVACPPEESGGLETWTPESLLIAAVDASVMATFSALAEVRGLEIVSYDSRAEGEIDIFDGGARFVRVVIRPRVVVADGSAIAEVQRALDDAHGLSVIARSMNAEVVIESIIETRHLAETYS